MAARFVLLYEPPDAYTLSLVRAILDDRGIPYRTRERGVSPTVWGMSGQTDLASMYVEVLVETERLDEAKQILCENDIVCDVSERLRQRGFESIAAPQLAGASEALDRLVRYLRVNNRSTVQAILEDIRAAAGGEALLIRLLFHLLGGDEPITLGRLAHFLDRSRIAGLRDAIEAHLPSLSAAARRDLASALEHLDGIDPDPILVLLLRDADPGVREAAIEALYALRGEAFGYEPDAPEEEREVAVRRWEETL